MIMTVPINRLLQTQLKLLNLDAETAPTLEEWQQFLASLNQVQNERVKQRYQDLIETLDDTVTIHDTEGQILAVNEAACRHLGYTRDELLHMKTTDIDEPSYAANFGNRIAVQLHEGRLNGITGVHITKDGRRIDIDVSSKLIDYGGQTAVFGVTRDITWRKQMETALLRQNQNQFQSIFDHSPVPIAMTSIDLKYLRVNRAYMDLLGYAEDDILNHLVTEFTHPDDVQHNLDYQRSMLNGNMESADLEKRYVTRDGRIIYALTKLALVRDEAGNPLNFVSTVIDMTAARENEAAVRESEQRFQSLYEAAERQARELALLFEVRSAISSKLELGDLFRTTVEAIASTFSYEIVGIYLVKNDRLHLQYSHGYYGEVVEISVYEGVTGQAARTGKPVLVPDVNQHKGYLAAVEGIVCELAVPLLNEGHVVGVLNVESRIPGTLTEADLDLMTLLVEHLGVAIERAQLYTEVRLAKEEYQLIVNSVPEVIFRLSLQGEWQFVNAAWAVLTGYSQDETIGKRLEDFLMPESVADHMHQIEILFREGEVRFETAFLHQDGTALPAEVHVLLLRDVKGELVGEVGSIFDIRERRRQEQQKLELNLKQRTVESLKQFLSAISHDLRTPLSVMNTSLYLLERKMSPENDLLGYVRSVAAQTQHLSAAVEDMLDMSHLDDELVEYNFMRVNLNGLIRDVLVGLESTIDAHKQQLAYIPDPQLPLIMVDQVMMGKVVRNLLENAIQFTPTAGSIHVRTRRDGNQVLLEVSDTGIGMAPEEMEQVFERFYKADKARPVDGAGVGLGLSIVKKIVEAHHGTIDLKSTVGKGTTFVVALPIVQPATVPVTP
jgi:PAS domain S-box-containing protein